MQKMCMWALCLGSACGPGATQDSTGTSQAGTSTAASSTSPGPTTTPTTGGSTSTSTTTTTAADTSTGGIDSSSFISDGCSRCEADEICVRQGGSDAPPPPECVPANGCIPADPCTPACAALCGASSICKADGPGKLACLSPHRCDIDDSPFFVCQDGEKCTPSDPLHHGTWSGTSCVPIDRDPGDPGEPCTVQDNPYSGLDDCAAGAMCWHVDPDTLTGTCLELCEGHTQGSCKTPGSECSVYDSGDLPLCLPRCDPLLQDCDPDEVCVPGSFSGVCWPDISGDQGQAGDPCLAATACDPGLICVNGAALLDCATPACCTDFCDLMAADPCPDMPGLMCLPWYPPGDAPPDLADLGACGVMQ